MVFLFIPIVLTEGDHFLPSFLKSFPGFAPAEDLGMRHISFVVVASLERPRGGYVMDLYWIFMSFCHYLSFCHFRSIFLVPIFCRKSIFLVRVPLSMMFVGARS